MYVLQQLLNLFELCQFINRYIQIPVKVDQKIIHIATIQLSNIVATKKKIHHIINYS